MCVGGFQHKHTIMWTHGKAELWNASLKGGCFSELRWMSIQYTSAFKENGDSGFVGSLCVCPQKEPVIIHGLKSSLAGCIWCRISFLCHQIGLGTSCNHSMVQGSILQLISIESIITVRKTIISKSKGRILKMGRPKSLVSVVLQPVVKPNVWPSLCGKYMETFNV